MIVINKLIFLFLIIEFILRIFKLAPKIPRGHNIYKESNELSYELKPNVSQIIDLSTGDYSFNVIHNSMGLRDYEFFDNNKNYKILALGDSYTYGWGAEFEETFLFKLENWLKVRIIKAGIPGYTTKASRLFLEKYKKYYNPDMTLLCFSHNDVTDVCSNKKFIISKKGYLIWNNPLFILAHFLYYYSYICRNIIKLLSNQFACLMLTDAKEELLKELKEEIIKIRDMSKKLVFIMMPDLRKPDIDISKWCKDNDIIYIDATFQDQHLFWKDGHCNPMGNNLIARLIYLKLKDEISYNTTS